MTEQQIREEIGTRMDFIKEKTESFAKMVIETSQNCDEIRFHLEFYMKICSILCAMSDSPDMFIEEFKWMVKEAKMAHGLTDSAL